MSTYQDSSTPASITNPQQAGDLPWIPNDCENYRAMAADPRKAELHRDVLGFMARHRYAYNFTWFGRPIIQLPSDIMAMQMLLLHHQPDLIIETGVAHGGSLIMYASMMELVGKGRVLGIDIDIRKHNREAIEAHPLARRISLIQGSSTDPAVVAQAAQMAKGLKTVFVTLDSNHTDAHVFAELQAYHQLVTPGGYLIVFDTVVEDQPAQESAGRPWGPGNSPKTAVHRFLKQRGDFSIDRDLEARLLFSVAPEGYLRKAR